MSNLSVVQAGLHAWESADWVTLEALLAEDFTLSGPVPQPFNKSQFLALGRGLLTAFPDWKFNITDWHEEGENVSGASHISGTHTGTLAIIPNVPPVPPTGKQVAIPEERTKYTVRAGKLVSFVVESGPNSGVPALYAQVGAPLPPRS